MLIAYYYPGSQNEHAAVDIYRLADTPARLYTPENARLEHVETREVSGKREARAVAIDLNAKPWNF